MEIDYPVHAHSASLPESDVKEIVEATLKKLGESNNLEFEITTVDGAVEWIDLGENSSPNYEIGKTVSIDFKTAPGSDPKPIDSCKLREDLYSLILERARAIAKEKSKLTLTINNAAQTWDDDGMSISLTLKDNSSAILNPEYELSHWAFGGSNDEVNHIYIACLKKIKDTNRSPETGNRTHLTMTIPNPEWRLLEKFKIAVKLLDEFDQTWELSDFALLEGK
ncbi:MAG: hypothetical protein KDA65_12275 [Planctomycetaceae bacterium]|nr:hypothetical protein [Planctomycetaceae bacterium]